MHTIAWKVIHVFTLVVFFITPIDSLLQSSTRNTPAWSTYTDDRFGFSVQYPDTWQRAVSFDYNFQEEEYVIRRRIAFSDATGNFFYIDTWDNRSGLALTDWLEAHQERFAILTPPTTIPAEANGVINGAAAFLSISTGSPQLIEALLADQTNIYRIQYNYSFAQEYLTDYYKVLSSFQLANSTAGDTDIAAVQDSLVRPTMSLVTTLQGDASCTVCGENFNDPQTNPYLCYAHGNCVWWAAFKREDITADQAWGDAKNWLGKAETENYVTCRTDPKNELKCYHVKGAVAWYSGGTWGHVAYVENSYPNDLVVSEMSYVGWKDGTDCKKQGPPVLGIPTGYIFGKRGKNNFPVVLYEHAGFFGQIQYFSGEGRYDLQTLKDKVSSIYIAPGWSAKLYTEPEQRGTSYIVDMNIVDLYNHIAYKYDGNQISGFTLLNDNFASIEIFHRCCLSSRSTF